jgi:hypothetical protein
MATYNLTLAVTVRIYGYTSVEADSMAEAIEIVRQHAVEYRDTIKPNLFDCVSEPDHDNASDHTIVSVTAPDDGILAGDMLVDISLTDEGGWTIKTAEELRAGLDIVEAWEEDAWVTCRDCGEKTGDHHSPDGETCPDCYERAEGGAA